MFVEVLFCIVCLLLPLAPSASADSSDALETTERVVLLVGEVGQPPHPTTPKPIHTQNSGNFVVSTTCVCVTLDMFTNGHVNLTRSLNE